MATEDFLPAATEEAKLRCACGAEASILTHDAHLCTACYAKRPEPPLAYEGVPIVADDSVPAGKILPIAPAPCTRCGRPFVPTADATVCSTCFAQLVNNAGKPADGGTKPLRLTASEVVEKDQLEHRGTLLPVITHDALIHASERLAESLANDPEGAAMLYAQAKDHGLMVMVVVQAAIPRDQQKPATVAPRRR